MKENLKIALLALIAVTLIINTFMKGDSSNDSSSHAEHLGTPVSSTSVSSNPEGIELTPNDPIIDNRPKTIMVFDEYDHDFGTIKQETENVKIFKFHNDGKEPLVITSAKGSCGCTVPEYPKEPIAPGASGEIKVVYSPGKQENMQAKSVTITANTDPETTVLKLTANVISSAPAAK